jgi:hypothetical protein
MGDSNDKAQRMKYVWEEELLPFGIPMIWAVEHHLKHCLPKTHGSLFDYKVSVAWVRKVGDRRWYCNTIGHGDKYFRTLKSAKAWAVAVKTLEET